ncbi:hypothetical protein GF312_03435 [Candidatus Poribacteria bacterium]|nr:hypothetical protein [Candidatus Poribacteria bacterium]
MKKILIGVVIISCLMIFIRVSQGMIVFTKSELTRDGFREFIIKEIYGQRNWWTFFYRNICVINPDGTGFMQLTYDNASYKPAWSPDGKTIAFCSGLPPAVSLHIMNPDGSDRIEALKKQNDIYDFRWSPDGKKIMVYVESSSPRNPEEIWISDIQNGDSIKYAGRSEWARGWTHWSSEGSDVEKPHKRLIEGMPEETEWPEWSPDNRYLAFVYDNKLGLADTEIVGLPEEWRQGQFDPPCNKVLHWSPDGSKILFLGGGYVSSRNVDGSGIKNLSMSVSEDACWNSDGTYIAYSASGGHKDNTEIYIMKADGTEHIQITNTNYFHLDLDWR